MVGMSAFIDYIYISFFSVLGQSARVLALISIVLFYFENGIDGFFIWKRGKGESFSVKLC